MKTDLHPDPNPTWTFLWIRNSELRISNTSLIYYPGEAKCDLWVRGGRGGVAPCMANFKKAVTSSFDRPTSLL
jgi:hypothetical protein